MVILFVVEDVVINVEAWTRKMEEEWEQTIEEPAMYIEGGDGTHTWRALTANRQRFGLTGVMYSS
jgi:hypothetical protein